jgi:hypothetical protein
MFFDHLKSKGWTEVAYQWEYTKGDWRIWFDTGHWMIVATKSNPRVFDVHAPHDYESAWTVNLIEHLCRMEDERHRFREALERIRDLPTSDQEARSEVRTALAKCYHSWLVNLEVPEGQMGRFFCPICRENSQSPAEPYAPAR